LAKRKQAAGTQRSRLPGKGVTQPTIRQLQDAADRARDWLSERRDYYGYLSRREKARGAPELSRHLRGDLLAKQGRDGSWGEGDLAATGEALWKLLDLGMPAGAPAVNRALDWLYSRRDKEGAYGSGCTPARHEGRICEHYLSGFFSPGLAGKPMEITLTNGQSVNSDAGARLLMSERALRSALRANPSDPRSSSSVAGLRSLPLYLEYGGSFTPAVLVGALQALAWADGLPSSGLGVVLELLASQQADDGTWPKVEFFFVLEMLVEVEHPVSAQMLKRALTRLLGTQHKHGSWGRRHVAAQTWIAAQAIETAGRTAR
jgi:hypothetical protein